MTTQSGGEKKLKSCKKREEIISTGTKLIIEKGYLNTSIQDITSKMGIAKGSFYTYFKSKDEFILAIIFNKISQFKVEVDEIIALESSLEETLRKYFLHALSVPAKEPEFFLLLMNLLRNINSLGKKIRQFLGANAPLKYRGVKKILEKYLDVIDVADEDELEKCSIIICNLVNTFYEQKFNPFVSCYNNESSKNPTPLQVKRSLESINLKNEVDFLTKIAMKIIRK